MGNIVKKRDPVAFLSPILSALSSIIYVTKKLISEENKKDNQDNKIEEQVKEIQKQEDSGYIAKLLEESTNSLKDTRKGKISVGKLENTNKTQSAKIKNTNKEYDEKEHERRV